MNEILIGKNILLTNIWLQNYAGSEINCLELSKEFIKNGANVEVATFLFGDPIENEYHKEGITVTNILDTKPRRKHYDIIWAHHSEVLDKLLFVDGITADKIITSSLGCFEPYEAPPLYANLLTKSLAVSEETRGYLQKMGIENIETFPNFFSNEWNTQGDTREQRNKIQQIAIVTNHLCSEIKEVKEKLLELEIDVNHIGGEIKELVTPNLLSKYDVIITIGKTVQYAMVMGIPVYCYDRFGGCGYINSDNYELAKHYNFSGRGFEKKNAEAIAEEIVNQYEKIVSEQNHIRNKAKNDFSLEKNLNKIISEIYKGNNVDMVKLHTQYVTMEMHAKAFCRLFREKELSKNKNKELKKCISELKLENKSIKKKYDKVINSKSWKITKPLRRKKKHKKDLSDGNI